MNPFYLPKSEKHAPSPESRTAAASRSWVCGEAENALDQAYSRPNLVVLEGITKQSEPTPTESIPVAAEQAFEPKLVAQEAAPEQANDMLNVDDARRNVEYIRYLTQQGEDHELAA